MRRVRVQLAQHAADLAEFGHQALLGVQAAGGVGDQHVDAARLRHLQCFECDRGGIRVLPLRDHGHAVPITPGLQLCDSRGAERVAGRQHQAAAFILVTPRQLADGGGLADAVDANGEDHERLAAGIDLQRLRHRHQHRHQVCTQGAQQRGRIGEFARLHPLAQAFDQLRAGGHPDIGGEQRGLDVVEQVVVEDRVAAEQFGDVAGEDAADPLLPAGLAGWRRGRWLRLRCECRKFGFDRGERRPVLHRRGDDFLGDRRFGPWFGPRSGGSRLRERRGQVFGAHATRGFGVGLLAAEPAGHACVRARRGGADE